MPKPMEHRGFKAPKILLVRAEEWARKEDRTLSFLIRRALEREVARLERKARR